MTTMKIFFEVFWRFGVMMLIILVGVWLFSMSDYGMTVKGYKQGQIDALTGTIKYELQIKSDSTSVWVKKLER